MKKERRAGKASSNPPNRPQQHECPHKARFLSGKRILPKGITGKEKLSDLMSNAYLAYNSARLLEGSKLFTEKMLEPDVTVGLTLSGALTPAGLGCSCVVPLDQGGFCRLDRGHRREPLSRPALRLQLAALRRQPPVRRPRAARKRRGANL
jgi:hypothetical protein